MASPIKNQKLGNFVTEVIEEMDTELKAVCYDITTKNGIHAIKALEKIRRKLKAMEGKVKTLVKLNESENPKFAKENVEMKKEIENKKKKSRTLKKMIFFSFLTMRPKGPPKNQVQKHLKMQGHLMFLNKNCLKNNNKKTLNYSLLFWLFL